MAVTIDAEPQLYTPSDNPITWTWSSDQTAQPNFSYVVELYINAVLDSRHLVFPQRGAFSHFDASERLKAVCPSAQLTSTAIQSASNLSTAYVKVIERYGATPTNQADATSSTVNVYKACLSEQDFVSYDYLTYISNFFTDFTENYFNFDHDHYLQFISNQTSNLSLQIQRFSVLGVPIGLPLLNAIPNTYKITQINLNSLFSLSGSSYIEVSVIETIGSTTIVSPIKYNLLTIDDCDNPSHLVWLNKYGAYDNYTFLHNITSKTDIQKLEYQSQFGQWNDSNEFVYSVETSGNKAYVKTMQDKGEIASGWINETLQGFIVPIYESPYVVVANYLETAYQITIDNSSYGLKQDEYEELFNEVLQFSKSNTRKSINL